MADGSADISLLGKIAGYTEILSKDPHSTVFVPLSEAYRAMGMLDEAIDIARRGISAVPGYAPGFITLGRSLAERGKLVESAETFAEALQIEESNLQALKGLARVRMLQGLTEQARPLLLKARQQAPDDAAIAKMLASLGAPRQAPLEQSPSTESSATGSDVPIATLTVAEIYERQGLHRKAYKVYFDLYRIDPGNQQLRRKLEELKHLIETTDHRPTPEPATVAPPSPQEPEIPHPEPAAPLAAVTQHQQLVDTYGQWLEVIQSRRSHV